MNLEETFPKSKGRHYGNTYEVLEEGVPKRVSSTFKLLCTVCECEVFMRPVKVFAGQKACKCGTMYYKNSARRKERLLEKLDGKNIKALSIPEDLKWFHKLDLECMTCGNSWVTQENNIVNYNNGCPACAGVQKLTSDDIDKRLSSLIGISKLGSYTILDYDWRKGSVEATCICGYSRIRTPQNVYTKSNSCPSCASYGFSVSRPATLYLLELQSKSGSVLGYKYGIAADMEQRHSKIARNFDGRVSVWASWDYSSGVLAQKHEKLFKDALVSVISKEKLPDGWTETFSSEYLNCFLTLQQTQYEQEW